MNEGVPGMTLRDWFAGQAMAAIIGCYRLTLRGTEDALNGSDADLTRFDRLMAIDENGVTGECDGCTEIAQDAYRFADAMLAERAKATEKSIDDTPVGCLNLSVRAENCLAREGIKTVGELRSKSDFELLRIRGLGKLSRKLVRAKLADFDQRNAKGDDRDHR